MPLFRGRSPLITTLLVSTALLSLLWIAHVESSGSPDLDSVPSVLAESPAVPLPVSRPFGHAAGKKKAKARVAQYLFPVGDPDSADISALENQKTMQALFTCLAEDNCAQNQTNVVLLGSYHFRGALLGWDGGEDLWARSTVEALQLLGYSVLYATQNLQRTIQVYQTFSTFISMVLLNPEELDRCFNDPASLCSKTPENPDGIPAWKLFSFNWWTIGSHPLDARWILSPEQYRGPGSDHTYTGYSVEAACAARQFVPHAERARRPQVYVMGKNGRYFAAGKRAWEPSQLALAAKALESAPVQLEDDATQVRFLVGLREDGLPEEFSQEERTALHDLGRLTPTEFYDTLAHSVALVGMGAPGTSPTPYDALCLGVAFINPVHIWDRANPTNRKAWSAQHETLKFLDPPYVYNVFVGDTGAFVSAVKSAAENPIESFVLPEMRLPEIAERLGHILRTDWRKEAEELMQRRKGQRVML
ncbi:hypothetical protein HMN09_01145800 [Mycena chlorophos]|uniref:Alpha-1,6-mannosyl-glycoprotein 6-beta-N-acetylglucosaminyltransferase n=1 Tax=Mycena chlorophos TaxID=658473 RepID=A0A8H6VZS9_MYCCL|nr:hypothetical protein HMN09_01145800 [Mycena chlorophos]